MLARVLVYLQPLLPGLPVVLLVAMLLPMVMVRGLLCLRGVQLLEGAEAVAGYVGEDRAGAGGGQGVVPHTGGVERPRHQARAGVASPSQGSQPSLKWNSS